MLATEYDELDRELGGLDDERAGRKPRGGNLRVLPIVVGVVSLLALGGIIWYAYTQGVREGSEDAAPLLRPDSQAKVEPDDPGGRQVTGVDMTIYDCVNGNCDSTPANAEIILPSPEEPLPPPSAPIPPAEVVEPVPPVPTPQTAEATTDPSTRAPVPAPGVPEVPNSLSVPEAAPPTAGTQTQEVAATAAVEPPAPPPAPPSAPPPAPTQTATAPATAAGTGWRIQIAALTSDAAARSQWAKIQSANSDLLGALALEVQQATVNGTQYFRVRGGPLASKADAKALCASLKAKNVACIPVAPGR